jgi:hypothetical protein
MAIQNLDALVQNKLQKMQARDLLKNLLSNQQQGHSLGNDMMSLGSVSFNPNQSVTAGDFLNQQPQNLIERSAGKTPLSLQSLFKSTPTMQPSTQEAQMPQVQQKEAQFSTTEPDRSWETPTIRARRELEEKKSKDKRQLQVDKETLPYYKKMREQSATTSEVDARLDQMEDLLDTGKVQGPTFLSFLDALKGLPYFIGKFGGAIQQAFTSTETQIFKKLSQDFLRDAKPYFGSNMSTTEVELFLERVPNLMQSTEGRRGVIRNFRALNEYTKEIDSIMEGIIAENGGERPRHLESKVQARSKRAAEKLRQSFRDSVKLIKKPKREEPKEISKTSELYKNRFLTPRVKKDQPQTIPI